MSAVLPKPRQRIRPLTSDKAAWEARESHLVELLAAARDEANKLRGRAWLCGAIGCVSGLLIGWLL